LFFRRSRLRGPSADRVPRCALRFLHGRSIVPPPTSRACRRPPAMLPASTLSAINNVVALHLEPHTTMKVLGAILAPVLSSELEKEKRAGGRGGPKPRRATRPRKKPKHQAARSRDARERAIAVLKANRGASLTAVAKAAGVSHGTAMNARHELAAEARKQA